MWCATEQMDREQEVGGTQEAPTVLMPGVSLGMKEPGFEKLQGGVCLPALGSSPKAQDFPSQDRIRS